MIYALPGQVRYPELDGAPTGLVGTVGVRVLKNSDNSVAVARATAGIVESPAGSGHYVATVTAPTQKGEYTILWDTGTVTPATTASEELEVVANLPAAAVATPGYPTRAQLLAASSVEELTGLSDDQVDALREAGIVAVEDFCGQSFAGSVTEERVLDGSGGNELWLLEHLESFTAVKLRGTLADLASFTLDNGGARLYWRPVSGALGYARIPWGDDTDTRIFRHGEGTVAITGTWGWSSCPPAVGQALRIDMEEQALADASKLAGSVTAYRRLGVRDTRQGGLAVALGPDAASVSARVARLLRAFVWAGPAGYVT